MIRPRTATGELAPTHGLSSSRTYRIWQGIGQRCNNPRARKFEYYGGRGIQLCPRWSSFELFLADLGECPVGLTIERIDNSGNYEPRNCRWATQKEQNRNHRRNRVIAWRGETALLVDWADRLGIKWNTLYYRLKRGWSVDRAFTTLVSR